MSLVGLSLDHTELSVDSLWGGLSHGELGSKSWLAMGEGTQPTAAVSLELAW